MPLSVNMRRPALLFVLVLAGIGISHSQASSPTGEIEPGSINNGVYTSQASGIAWEIPKDWVIPSKGGPLLGDDYHVMLQLLPGGTESGRSRCGLAMAIQALSPARQSSGSRDTNHVELCIAVARLASRGQIFDLLVSPLTRLMRRLPGHRDGNGRTPPPDPESPARSLIRRSPCAAPLLLPRRA